MLKTSFHLFSQRLVADLQEFSKISVNSSQAEKQLCLESLSRLARFGLQNHDTLSKLSLEQIKETLKCISDLKCDRIIKLKTAQSQTIQDWYALQLQYLDTHGIKDLDNLKNTRSRHELQEKETPQVNRSSSLVDLPKNSQGISQLQLRKKSTSPYVNKKSYNANAEEPDINYEYLDQKAGKELGRNDSEKVLARLRGIKYLKKGTGTGGGNVGTLLMRDPQYQAQISSDKLEDVSTENPQIKTQITQSVQKIQQRKESPKFINSKSPARKTPQLITKSPAKSFVKPITKDQLQKKNYQKRPEIQVVEPKDNKPSQKLPNQDISFSRLSKNIKHSVESVEELYDSVSPLANKRVSSRNNKIILSPSEQNQIPQKKFGSNGTNNVVKDNSVVRKRFMQMMSGIVDDDQLKEVQHFIEHEEEQSRSLKNKKKNEKKQELLLQQIATSKEGKIGLNPEKAQVFQDIAPERKSMLNPMQDDSKVQKNVESLPVSYPETEANAKLSAVQVPEMKPVIQIQPEQNFTAFRGGELSLPLSRLELDKPVFTMEKNMANDIVENSTEEKSLNSGRKTDTQSLNRTASLQARRDSMKSKKSTVVIQPKKDTPDSEMISQARKATSNKLELDLTKSKLEDNPEFIRRFIPGKLLLDAQSELKKEDLKKPPINPISKKDDYAQKKLSLASTTTGTKNMGKNDSKGYKIDKKTIDLESLYPKEHFRNLEVKIAHSEIQKSLNSKQNTVNQVLGLEMAQEHHSTCDFVEQEQEYPQIDMDSNVMDQADYSRMQNIEQQKKGQLQLQLQRSQMLIESNYSQNTLEILDADGMDMQDITDSLNSEAEDFRSYVFAKQKETSSQKILASSTRKIDLSQKVDQRKSLEKKKDIEVTVLYDDQDASTAQRCITSELNSDDEINSPPRTLDVKNKAEKLPGNYSYNFMDRSVTKSAATKPETSFNVREFLLHQNAHNPHNIGSSHETFFAENYPAQQNPKKAKNRIKTESQQQSQNSNQPFPKDSQVVLTNSINYTGYTDEKKKGNKVQESPEEIRKKAHDNLLRMKLDGYFFSLNLSYSIEQNPEVDVENYIRAIYEISEAKSEFERIVHRILQEGEVLLGYIIALSLENDIIFLNVARTTGAVGLRNSGVDTGVKLRVIKRLLQIIKDGVRDGETRSRPDKSIYDYLNTYYSTSGKH